MDRPATYQEIDPAPDLGEAVECFWSRRQLTSPERPAESRVLPDGCVDIIFDLGTVSERRGRARAFVVGTMTKPREFTFTGAVDFLGVRFRPGVAAGFLGVPVDELTDLQVPLGSLPGWGDDAERSVEELLDASGGERRIGIFERALRRRSDPEARSSGRVRRAVDELVTSGGTARIARVAEIVGVSRQHLTRRFKAEIGIGPKLLARIVRFRAATEAARSRTAIDGDPSWTEIAHRLGYSDQSHLIADFREFSGLPPERWLRRQA